ncbi:DUF1735 domain-containing protein [Pedobacter sp. SD-b]|uniref:DUF1735 domain-containing protein n=1 Tax=Pedobacter segetis TaxID=2793069 RepID=A0ABS1BIZ4_9SPHI|nr:DUF1735 domain-containing protein [Pedobacter segetis]MBK0382850.1 DUF1735 domain-containing protein [Pedobacter segetis]
MKLFKNIAFIAGVALCFTACKKYESYVVDYTYSTVYFASQKPLRTIVANDDMSFRVGVMMGGVRSNTKDQTVKYEIDPSLLTTVPGASSFTLLPTSYYTLSDNSTMIIPKGQVLGEVKVTLNKSFFTADQASVTNIYALPLRIVSSTTDSVLRGDANHEAKDYTILVVKYISPYSGTYYHKGVETSGSTVNSYTNKDLNQNATWALSTLSVNELQTPGSGSKSTPNLKLVLNGSNVSVVDLSKTAPNNVTGSGTYDLNSKSLFLNYNYDQGTSVFSVKDTLILRQSPESELRFEEW